jgi:tetratricopeptide (TPR) repeat protein
MNARSSVNVRALLVSHRGQQCGVYQFGRRLFQTLVAGGGIDWIYAECDNFDELLTAAKRAGVDVVVLNYHPATLAWATTSDLEQISAVTFAIFHEIHQSVADTLVPSPFHFVLCPDPTILSRNPIALAVPRFIPEPVQPLPVPELFTIGSFGFATLGKGFEKLCSLVSDQFDVARLRINIPLHDQERIVSREQRESIVTACFQQISKPGIHLEITQDFLDDERLLKFLAENTINAFLYDDNNQRGISSCTDYALASGRPVAISRSPMFRHLHRVNPSICVEDRSLFDIAEAGAQPLYHHRDSYLPRLAGATWNQVILDAVAARASSLSVPDQRGFNKILDDRSRVAYTKALKSLEDLVPSVYARKIPRANIQQAFAFDAVERLIHRFRDPRILAIGSFEDTAVAALRAKGFRLDEVDPNVNGLSLADFYYSTPVHEELYDIILCISVLEHVEDDVTFVRMVGDLLSIGGIAIFTVDFSNSHTRNSNKPTADWRLYNSDDLRQRLTSILPDCAMLDHPDWEDGCDDFEYEGCRYSFASWVIRRIAQKGALGPTDHQPDLDLLYSMVSGPFYSEIGVSRYVRGQRIFTTDGSHKGVLMYGPYMSLPPGEYAAMFVLTVDDILADDTHVELDVYSDIRRIAFGRYTLELDSSSQQKATIFVPFVINEPVSDIEFRVLVGSLTALTVVAQVILLTIPPCHNFTLQAVSSLMAGDVGRLAETCAELRTQIKDLRQAFDQSQGRIVTLEQDLKKACKTADLLAADAERTTVEISTLVMQRDQMAGALDETRNALVAVRADRDRIASESSRWYGAALAISDEFAWLARARRMQPPRFRWWRTSRTLAGRTLRRILRRQSTSPKMLAEVAMRAESWEMAARYYRDAIAGDPNNPRLWSQLGHALREAGKPAEAEIALAKSIDLDPRRS